MAAAVSALLLLGACGGDSDEGSSGSDPTPAAGGSAGGGASVEDPSEAVFDPDRLLHIEIELAPEDWEVLRYQTRSLFDLVGGSCLSEPPPRPFTYFPATVTIDGETVDNVGVRKKGFYGSLSDTKPSLKVKFHEYIEQEYSGVKRFTLNNAKSDASYIKQCLGYAVFTQAGVPAPRCNFATVTVNGQDLGLYVNVESIKKRFLARHFDDNEGDLWEGALSDFRPDWVNTFQKKTNKSDLDLSDLQAVVDALAVPDGGLLGRVEPLVNLEEFISFWAAEFLIMHADGYARNTNNFYLYHDPISRQFHFIPWGIDSIMFPDTALEWEDARPEGAVWAEGILSRRLYLTDSTQAAYFSRLEDLLESVWHESVLSQEIDRMVELIDPYITADERAGFTSAVRDVREFVQDRRAEIEAAMPLRPSYSGPLRDPWCIEPIGQISGTFSTTWGMLDVEDPFGAGTGTLDVQLAGQPQLFTRLGTVSGADEDSGKPAVRWAAMASDTEIWVAQVSLTNESNFAAGMSVPIDWTEAMGVLIKLDLSTMEGGEPEFEIAGMLGDGVIEFDAAGTQPGATVSGRLLTTTVYEALF